MLILILSIIVTLISLPALIVIIYDIVRWQDLDGLPTLFCLALCNWLVWWGYTLVEVLQ